MVAGLNEVRTPTVGGGNQAQALADTLGLSWLFASTAGRLLQQELGNAVLSRLPISRYDVIPLIYEGDLGGAMLRSRSHRNMIRLETEIGGQPTIIIVTHLDRGPLRLVQLDQVLAEFMRHPRAILMGDLNSPHADVLPRIEGRAQSAVCIGEPCEDQIDYILTRGFKVTDRGSVPVGVSDHPYFWALLEPGF